VLSVWSVWSVGRWEEVAWLLSQGHFDGSRCFIAASKLLQRVEHFVEVDSDLPSPGFLTGEEARTLGLEVASVNKYGDSVHKVKEARAPAGAL